ncbi:MAG: transglycosylase SLT domain-containing protein [bacterium]
MKTMDLPDDIQQKMREASREGERERGERRRSSLKHLAYTALIVVLLGLVLALGAVLFGSGIAFGNGTETTVRMNVSGMVVNEEALRLIGSGQTESLFAFYDRQTRDRSKTVLVIAAALTQRIPLNGFFALGCEESDFTSRARNVNTDGSIDVGDYQLNTRSFPGYSVAELAEPALNISLSAQKLSADSRRLGKWLKALLVYNCGRWYGDVKQITMEHFIRILETEAELDAGFAEVVLSEEGSP